MTLSVIVFVVEDDELIRPLLEEGLTDRDYIVAISTDGEQTMAMLDAEE